MSACFSWKQTKRLTLQAIKFSRELKNPKLMPWIHVRNISILVLLCILVSHLSLVIIMHILRSTTMTNFAKLNQEMGFQRSSTSDEQKVQPISTKVVKNDENRDMNILGGAPSALGSFDRIVAFLDYDGTLSPIVDDPDRAFMSNERRQYAE